MENKFSGTIPEYEKLVAELQKELDRQNEVILQTLDFVEKIADNNAKWGQNLLTVTKDFNKFKSTIIKAIVWFSIGFLLSLLARALQLFN